MKSQRRSRTATVPTNWRPRPKGTLPKSVQCPPVRSLTSTSDSSQEYLTLNSTVEEYRPFGPTKLEPDQETLVVTPKRTTSSVSRRSTPNKSPQCRALIALGSSCPSPYKSFQPKELIKKIERYKEECSKQRAQIEKAAIANVQLIKSVEADISSIRNANICETNVPIDDFDNNPLLTRVFSPGLHLNQFDESSLNPNSYGCGRSGFVSISSADIVDHLIDGSLLITNSREARLCCYLLSVTTNSLAVDLISQAALGQLSRGFLPWQDLQNILFNLGLPKKSISAKRTSHRVSTPQKWNLEFLLMLIAESFPHYRTSCGTRVLSLLVDLLFEPLMADLHSMVILLLRRVLKHLLAQCVPLPDLVRLLDRSHLSAQHNGFIFQYVAMDPSLTLLAQTFAFSTIRRLLQLDHIPLESQPTRILPLLADQGKLLNNIDLKAFYELLMVCERLIVLGLDDASERGGLIRTLTTLAGEFRRKYNADCFGCIHITDTITRFRSHSAS